MGPKDVKPRKVRKSSGIIEDFQIEKLRTSLQRTGASEDIVDEIVERVLLEAGPETSTRRIYRLAKKYLKRLNHPSGLRYSLKQALFRLGPSGYPFERYIGELFRSYGYSAEVGLSLEGRCVGHEVDVLAVNSEEIYAIECKYHNTMGRTTDVKVAMYVNSRMQDLEPALTVMHPERRYVGWLVTNTRCTSDAVRYADCVGLKVMGWRHPDNKSLETMIEEKRLYPVTIISGIKKGLVRKLIENHVILLKDLVDMNLEEVVTAFALTRQQARALKKQADELCAC